jgi:hypothetical protein
MWRINAPPIVPAGVSGTATGPAAAALAASMAAESPASIPNVFPLRDFVMRVLPGSAPLPGVVRLDARAGRNGCGPQEKKSAVIDGCARSSVSIAPMSHVHAFAAAAPVSGHGAFAFGWWRWTSSRWRG